MFLDFLAEYIHILQSSSLIHALQARRSRRESKRSTAARVPAKLSNISHLRHPSCTESRKCLATSKVKPYSEGAASTAPTSFHPLILGWFGTLSQLFGILKCCEPPQLGLDTPWLTAWLYILYSTFYGTVRGSLSWLCNHSCGISAHVCNVASISLEASAPCLEGQRARSQGLQWREALGAPLPTWQGCAIALHLLCLVEMWKALTTPPKAGTSATGPERFASVPWDTHLREHHGRSTYNKYHPIPVATLQSTYSTIYFRSSFDGACESNSHPISGLVPNPRCKSYDRSCYADCRSAHAPTQCCAGIFAWQACPTAWCKVVMQTVHTKNSAVASENQRLLPKSLVYRYFLFWSLPLVAAILARVLNIARNEWRDNW